jgi:hypothetical protein
VVVLGGGDEDPVGLPDRLLEAGHGLRVARGLDVAVVERHLVDFKDRNHHPRGRQLAGGPHERPVVRALPEASREGEDVQVSIVAHGFLTTVS